MAKKTVVFTQEEIELAQKCLDLKERRLHPEGRFDQKKRWHPYIHTASSERIREPSAAWPFSLLNHCRTVIYQSQLAGLDPKRIRKAMREIAA